MPEAAKDHPVLQHFRQKDPRTGKSQTYHPHGDDEERGWGNAKAFWTGVPGSPEARELLEHAEGPLIGEPAATKTAVSAPGKES